MKKYKKREKFWTVSGCLGEKLSGCLGEKYSIT